MKERIKNVLNFKKPSRIIIITAVVLTAVLAVGLAMIKADSDILNIPTISAVNEEDGQKIELIRFGATSNETKVDSIAPWLYKYAIENTLVIDGELGQKRITLSAEKPEYATYKIYLTDGTVYDDGTREPYSSLMTRLLWNSDRSRIDVISPFEPGEYIYAVTLGWKEKNLEVTYGFKVIMTGERSTFDEALSVIRERRPGVISVSLKGIEYINSSGSNLKCYVFDIELSNGKIETVAVSDDDKSIFLSYKDGQWE